MPDPLDQREVAACLQFIQEVAQGNLEMRASPQEFKLLTPLAEALNALADSLLAREQALKSYMEAADLTLFELRGAYEELTTLHLLATTISSTFDLSEVLNLFTNLAREVIDYQACALVSLNGEALRIEIARDLSPSLREALESPQTRNLLSWCCKENKVVPISFEALTGNSSPLGQESPLSYVLVPIMSHHRTIGILVLECPMGGEEITQQKLTLLSLLAGQTGTSCENADLYRDMKQTNIDLARLKSYLENILETITTGIISFDREGNITTLNRAAERLFHVSSDDAVGKPFFTVLRDPVRAAVRNLLMSTMLNQEVKNYELEISLDQTRSQYFSFATSLLLDELRNPVGFVLMCRDVTETKELDAMKRLSQLKSEFLSHISHELRTPLTSIKAYAETLIHRGKKMPEEVILECLRIMDSESDRLARLVDDLLDFSRMEQGRVKLQRRSVNLVDLMGETIGQMKVQTSKNTFVFVPPPAPVHIEADHDRIKQALINLLSNAIKYSPDGGPITCTIEEDPTNAVLSVRDTGIGISQEDLPRIFEKFYRVEGPEAYRIGGTGLGLPITKAIVDAHDGSIRVESQVGVGTTFFLTLPKEPQIEEPNHRPASQAMAVQETPQTSQCPAGT